MLLHLSVCLALAGLAGRARAYHYNPNYLVPQNCKECDAMSCPQLIYCAGKKVKDNCGCCERCSSDLYQPHVPANSIPVAAAEEPTADACQQRKCPRFKVCMINIQGLPICTCPSKFVCDPRRKKKKGENEVDTTICGSDGNTYESRCHMRVANCVKGKRIRRKHSGACLPEESKLAEELDKIPDTIPEQDVVEIDKVGREDRERLKAIEKVKRRKQKRKRMKERRKRRKEKKNKKSRDKRRRMKRRNNGFSLYSNRYNKLIGKHTKWGRSQVRKSRI